MKLVVGGAFQGKFNFVNKQFPDVKEWLDGYTCSRSEIFACKGMVHFHDFIKRELKEGRSTEGLAEEIIEKNPDIIIVSNELGYGVVPVDPFDRKYREAVGRVCEILAAFSEEVYRVVCGIGTAIKKKED